MRDIFFIGNDIGFSVSSSSAQYSTLTDCTLRGNLDSGARVDDGGTSFYSCVFDNNTGRGLYIARAYVTVTNSAALLSSNILSLKNLIV